jgi:hypothetical protein
MVCLDMKKHSEIKVVEESTTVKLLIISALGFNLGVLFSISFWKHELKLGCCGAYF